MDLVFLPRLLHADKPAAVIELKCDDTAESGIAQIRERHYTKVVEDYKGRIILAGISYDRKTKKHTCRMEIC